MLRYIIDLPDCYQHNDTVVCLFVDNTKLSTTLSHIVGRVESQESLNDFIIKIL